MEWQSIEEIKSTFSFGDTLPIGAVRKALLMQAVSLHPDSSPGAKLSNEEHEQYLRIMSAVKFLDEKIRGADAQLPAIQRAGAVAPIPQYDNRTNERLLLQSTSAGVRTNYLKKRLGTGVLLAILAGIYTYSEKLLEHPLIGKLVAYLSADCRGSSPRWAEHSLCYSHFLR